MAEKEMKLKDSTMLKYLQRGQISILLAFIFPILVVFFGMTINIGLVIHDKINLQNSTDLAAYYAASKQAEVLNAIAHINYQIRQSWKLLAFRVRGFGDMGRGRLPPSNPTSPPPIHPWSPNSPGLNEDPFDNGDPAREFPSICAQDTKLWRERFFGDPETDPNRKGGVSCNVLGQFQPPIIVPKPVLLLGSGINRLTSQITQQLKDLGEDLCQLRGISNWVLGAYWLAHYQSDVQRKRWAIEELATKLKEGKDLSGADIKDGVQRTLENNLTRSNRDAFDTSQPHFQWINSMEDVELTDWLVVRGLYPIIYYTDATVAPGCTTMTKDLRELPEDHPDNPLQVSLIQSDLVKQLHDLLTLPTDILIKDADNALPAIGYEKNPWYMIYSGVSVTTRPQEPFSPLSGYRPSLKAKAFAKPFGGKIGPWMYPSWESSQPQSVGRFDQQIDPLLPLSIEGETDPANATSAIDDLNKYVPNYSRFPGDELGLRSIKGLGIYKQPFDNLRVGNQPVLSYNYFANEPQHPTDILMWDSNVNMAPPARILEVLAVAPDLFDITYYSIDPQFVKNYQEFMEGNFFREHLFRDFGARQGHGGQPYHPLFGVFDQVYWANNAAEALFPPQTELQPLEGEWVVKNWQHLLTGWVPDMADDLFGNCKTDDPDLVARKIASDSEPFPSSCPVGGRTGFSVKLVSKKYLQSKNLRLGGTAGRGPIINDVIPDDF